MAGGARHSADDKLVLLLAAGVTGKAAARRAGVSRRTVTRRLADPEFRRRVSATRQLMLSRAVGQLAHTLSRAVNTLKALLGAAKETVRLNAAKTIVESAFRGAELLELAQRVADLEDAQQQDGRP